MAFSTKQIIPATVNLTWKYVAGGAGALNDLSITLSPSVPGGAKLDCTPISTITLKLGANLQSAFPVTSNASLTIDTKDATGVTAHISASSLNSLITALKSLSGSVDIWAYDGVGNYVLGTGTFNLDLIA